MAPQPTGIRQFAALAARPSGGFTLIELVVAIAITVAALLVATPLTTSWVDSARVNETQALFQQAYSKAKALALRNEGARHNLIPTDDVSAAAICKTGSRLAAYKGACGDELVWEGDIPGGTATEIEVNGTSFSYLELNNAGVPIAQGTFGSPCVPKSKKILQATYMMKISKGGENVCMPLY